MGYRNWDRAIESGQFEADCRQLRKQQGLDPNEKPTHQWLIEHGFSGIQHYAKRHGMTVDEVLVDQLGFREATYDYDITHEKTERLVREFIREEDEDFGTWNNTTVRLGKTALKRMAEFSRKARGTDDLVDIGNEEKSVAREILKQIFNQMEEEVDDGTCRNYSRALERFFNHLEDIGEIEVNPVPRLRERKADKYKPDRVAPKEADVPDATDIRTLMETEDPMLQAAILLLGGAGDRPTKLTARTTDDFDLDPNDPKIYIGSENKTGPSGNALMAGQEFLKDYCEVMDRLQAGDSVYLFPSEKGSKPYLSYEELKDRIEQHAEKKDVTMHDGSPIKPKSLKQFYLNLQTEAKREFREQDVREATEAVGDDSAEIKDDHYIYNRQNRDHFRTYAKGHFSAAFPPSAFTFDTLADLRDEIDPEENQTTLNDFY